MYGLPKDVDLGFFINKTLLQACFGVNDLIFHFDGDVSITITSTIGCMESDGNIRQYDDMTQAAPTVMTLLNQSVVSAEGDEAGTLTLRFDGDGIFMIYDESKKYESYVIKNGEQLIIV